MFVYSSKTNNIVCAVNLDIKMKELCIMKLLNHILQPTIYDDVRDVAREWVIEDNMDKYLVRIIYKYIVCYVTSMSSLILI